MKFAHKIHHPPKEYGLQEFVKELVTNLALCSVDGAMMMIVPALGSKYNLGLRVILPNLTNTHFPNKTGSPVLLTSRQFILLSCKIFKTLVCIGTK